MRGKNRMTAGGRMRFGLRVVLGAIAFCTGSASVPAQVSPIGAGLKPSVLYFRVTNFGVEPPRVVVPAGPAILVVENTVNISGLKLDLQLPTKANVLQLVSRNGGLRMRESLTLLPGTYVLQDPRRPKWQAVVVVEERR